MSVLGFRSNFPVRTGTGDDSQAGLDEVARSCLVFLDL